MAYPSRLPILRRHAARFRFFRRRRSPRLQKLPGRTPLLHLSRGALALGENSLLQTRSTLYREYYSRYDYKDIQALVLRRTARGIVYNFILGLLLGAFALIAVDQGDIFWRLSFGGVALFWLALLIVNTARGATSHCTLHTALGGKALPTLSRMRSARRTLRLIVDRVEAAQGALGPAAAAEQMENFLQASSRGEPARVSAAAAASPEPARTDPY